MSLVQCEKGHFYDNGKFQECPVCQGNKQTQAMDQNQHMAAEQPKQPEQPRQSEQPQQQMQSIVCPSCHHQLPEKKKFCPYCGYHFEEGQFAQKIEPLQQEQPQQVEYQQQEQPQQMEYQQPMQPQQPVKKKKSKKGLLIIILILLVLVGGIAVGAVVLYPMIQKSGLVQKLEDTAASEEKTGADEENQEDQTAEENTIMTALQEKMDAGDYEGVLTDILAMQEGDESYEDAIALLPDAIDGQLTAKMEDVDNLVSASSYLDAFAALTEEEEYRSGLSGDERVSDFVSDHTAIEEKREAVTQSYQEYVIEEAMSCANSGDEDGIKNLFAEASEYLDNDEFETSKTAVYAKLVVTTANGMNAKGDDAGEVLDYIDQNLSKVENDCWVLELWDYFNALQEYQAGNVTSSTKVKHVTNGYILPDSDSEYLADADLSNLSRTELRMARYEIYARHGRVFSDAEVSDYFGQYDWYDGNVQPEEFDESELNEYEKANRDLLISYEEFMGYR